MKNINKEKIPKEISISNYIYQNNHYYFKLDIEYQDDFPSEQMNKRYGEIRQLYKLLILKCPGCLIPEIKSKTFIMKHIRITDKERQQMKLYVENFLNYIIKHPILIEKKIVLNFFSKDNESIYKQNNLNEDKIKKYLNEDDNFDNEDSSSTSKLNQNNDDEELDEDKKINIDDFEIIQKEEYQEFFEDEEENELLNMFLEEENNKNKGLISMSKDLLMSTYKYLRKFSDNENNNQETDLLDAGKTFKGSNFQEKDFEFIKSNYNELGENNEINNYGKEIMKINEGIDYLIKNFEKEVNICEKKNKALENIINIFEEDNNKENNKTNTKKDDKNIKDDFEDITLKDNDNDSNENKDKNINKNWEMKLYLGDINKIKNYTQISKKFVLEDLKETIEKINEYKNVVEGLIDIFIRKNKHIQFLLKLRSQLSENEKRNELTEENDKNKNNIKTDINFFKKKIELEKSFINKLNQNLKYEIDLFKEKKENTIYTFIVNLYKNNYLKQNEIFDIMDKEISLDSDSENSSKIKLEKKRSRSDSDFSAKSEDKEKNDEKSEDDF